MVGVDIEKKKKKKFYKLLPANKADHLCQYMAIDVTNVSPCQCPLMMRETRTPQSW